MKLKPEDFEKIELKKLATVIRRVNMEKPLSAAQEALLEREKAKALGEAPGTPAAGYVGTWDELAQQLGVTARAIRDWRDHPDLGPEIKKRWRDLVRADERKCVAEWHRFMIEFNLKRGAAAANVEVTPETDDGEEEQGIIKPPRVGGSQAAWNVAIAALDHRKKENAVRQLEGTLLIAAELEVPLGATFAAIQTKLAQFPSRVARSLVGRRDPGEVEDVLRDEIDADLLDLQSASYAADDAVARAVAAVPFDAETAQLARLVTFDGQDQAALLSLITAVATQALRLMGRRAIMTSKAVDEANAIVESRLESAHASIDTATASASVVPGPSALAKAPESGPDSSSKKPPAKKTARKKARTKSVPPPADVEAALYAKPRKKR